jgi:hypothetical protein
MMQRNESLVSGMGVPIQINNHIMVNNHMEMLYNDYLNIQNGRYIPTIFNYWIPIIFMHNSEQIQMQGNNYLKFLYLCDGLYIPYLLEKLQLTKRFIGTTVKNYNQIQITSNCKILKYNNESLVLLTNNRFIPNMQNNVVNDDKTIRFEFENLSDSVYIGNANNKREQVDTSIYKDATWVSIYN